jgi:hypothetical protein
MLLFKHLCYIHGYNFSKKCFFPHFQTFFPLWFFFTPMTKHLPCDKTPSMWRLGLPYEGWAFHMKVGQWFFLEVKGTTKHIFVLCGLQITPTCSKIFSWTNTKQFAKVRKKNQTHIFATIHLVIGCKMHNG